MNTLNRYKNLKVSTLLTFVFPIVAFGQVSFSLKLPKDPLNPKKLDTSIERKLKDKPNKFQTEIAKPEQQAIEKIKEQKDKAKGGIDSAGGNSVGSELLDFFEMTNLKRFRLEELEEATLLENTLSMIATNKFPSIKLITEDAKAKRWYFSSEEIHNSYCLNISRYMHKTKVVACQNAREVVIDKNWFDSTNKTNRVGLIIHELLVGNLFSDKIYDGTPEREYTVRTLVRDFFDIDALDESERQELIKVVAGRWYLTPTQYKNVLEKIRLKLPEIEKHICVGAAELDKYYQKAYASDTGPDTRKPLGKITEIILEGLNDDNRKSYHEPIVSKVLAISTLELPYELFRLEYRLTSRHLSVNQDNYYKNALQALKALGGTCPQN